MAFFFLLCFSLTISFLVLVLLLTRLSFLGVITAHEYPHLKQISLYIPLPVLAKATRALQHLDRLLIVVHLNIVTHTRYPSFTVDESYLWEECGTDRVMMQRGFSAVLTGHYGLMANILYRAYHDLTDSSLKWKTTAKLFFLDTSEDFPSFLYICDALNLCPSRIMKRINEKGLLATSQNKQADEKKPNSKHKYAGNGRINEVVKHRKYKRMLIRIDS